MVNVTIYSIHGSYGYGYSGYGIYRFGHYSSWLPLNVDVYERQDPGDPVPPGAVDFEILHGSQRPVPSIAVNFQSNQCGTGWDDGLQQSSSHTGQGYMMIYVFWWYMTVHIILPYMVYIVYTKNDILWWYNYLDVWYTAKLFTPCDSAIPWRKQSDPRPSGTEVSPSMENSSNCFPCF